MPTVWRFAGMRIQVFTKEPTNEVPHVHVIFGKGHGKAVVKVLLNDSLDVRQKRNGVLFPGKKLAIALDIIDRHKQEFLNEWAMIHGQPMQR